MISIIFTESSRYSQPRYRYFTDYGVAQVEPLKLPDVFFIEHPVALTWTEVLRIHSDQTRVILASNLADMDPRDPVQYPLLPTGAVTFHGDGVMRRLKKAEKDKLLVRTEEINGIRGWRATGDMEPPLCSIDVAGEEYTVVQESTLYVSGYLETFDPKDIADARILAEGKEWPEGLAFFTSGAGSPPRGMADREIEEGSVRASIRVIMPSLALVKGRYKFDGREWVYMAGACAPKDCIVLLHTTERRRHKEPDWGNMAQDPAVLGTARRRHGRTVPQEALQEVPQEAPQAVPQAVPADLAGENRVIANFEPLNMANFEPLNMAGGALGVMAAQ